MIMLEQPALCLNSDDVPGPHYNMWRTVTMRAGITPSEVVQAIIAAQVMAIGAEHSSLANIVINCHGYEGGLGLSTGGHGSPGFNISNVGLFSALKPLNIGPIWLVACQAARGSNGISFCQKLAAAAGTMVIAGEDNQELTGWQTIRYYTTPLSGMIDEYEGVVYVFYPNGVVLRDVDPEKVIMTVKV